MGKLTADWTVSERGERELNFKFFWQPIQWKVSLPKTGEVN